MTVIAVIPTFGPTLSIVDLAASVLDQVEMLVIVDDGSGAEFDEVFAALPNGACIVLRMDSNSGIAAALNKGVSAALSMGADFILTLDQDSAIPAGYIAQLLQEHSSAREAGISVGIVAPWVIADRPSTKAYVESEGFILGSEPIQSGQLVPAATFESIGYFSEDLFIDCVDTEFYLRCVEKGLSSVFVRDANLGHAIGSAAPAMLFGRQVTRKGGPLEVRFHPPFRNYYIYRNTVILLRRYGRKHATYRRSALIGMWKRVVITMMFSPARTFQLQAILSGLLHGFLLRSGKLPMNMQRRWSVRARVGGK